MYLKELVGVFFITQQQVSSHGNTAFPLIHTNENLAYAGLPASFMFDLLVCLTAF